MTNRSTADKIDELIGRLTEVREDLARGLPVAVEMPAELNDQWQEIVWELGAWTTT